MRKETKELVEWIKCQILINSDDSYKITKDATEKHFSLVKDSIKFLDSLPEIESHLCNGGYIQDKNGTPCCHGDDIKIKFRETSYNQDFISKYGSEVTVKLMFDREGKRFIVKYENEGSWNDWACCDCDVEWFEKVKN